MSSVEDELAARRAENAAKEAVTQGKHPDVVERLNALHAVITIGGKTSVMTERESTQFKGRIERTFSQRQDLQLQYLNDRYTCGLNKSGKPIIKTADAIWLESPERRQYDEIIFDPRLPPGGNDQTHVYNMFRGWPIKMDAKFLKPASIMKKWKKTRDHIHEVICRGNPLHTRWVLAWMSERFKHPERLAMVAIVLLGEEGAGKGTFATDIVGGCYHPQHFLPIASQELLTGRFNMHLADSLLVFADEAFFAGDPRGTGPLFAMITERTVMHEAKFLNAVPLPNMRAIIMASNNMLVIPAGPRARRFAVFEVDESHIRDYPYFQAIRDELADGGREEMLRYLLQEDFSDVNVYDAPMTGALMRQKELNFSPPIRYWFNLLRDRYVPQTAGPILAWENEMLVPISAFVRDYIDQPYMRKAHESKIRAAETELGITLARLIPSRRKRQLRAGGTPTRYWELPALSMARAEFGKAIGGEYTWDDTKDDV